jgi:hypothetical protein
MIKDNTRWKKDHLKWKEKVQCLNKF